jgi:hypothetical protein
MFFIKNDWHPCLTFKIKYKKYIPTKHITYIFKCLGCFKKEKQINNNISIQHNFTKQVISINQNIVYDKHHFFQHIRKSFLMDLKPLERQLLAWPTPRLIIMYAYWAGITSRQRNSHNHPCQYQMLFTVSVDTYASHDDLLTMITAGFPMQDISKQAYTPILTRYPCILLFTSST